MYEELIKSLRVCAIAERDYECAGCAYRDKNFDCNSVMKIDAADAIEYLVRLRNAAEENRMHWQEMAVKFECDLHDAEGKIPKWVPVNERLPEKPGNYLTAMGNGNIIENVFMMDYSDAWQNWHPHGKWYYNEAVWDGITHWMPLPEPPKEE